MQCQTVALPKECIYLCLRVISLCLSQPLWSYYKVDKTYNCIWKGCISPTCNYMVTTMNIELNVYLHFILCSVFLPISRGVKVSLRRARSPIRVADLVLWFLFSWFRRSSPLGSLFKLIWCLDHKRRTTALISFFPVFDLYATPHSSN